MGEVPIWYRALKAGQYLGVPPWQAGRIPLAWIERAEEAQAAENHAMAAHEKLRQAQAGLR